MNIKLLISLPVLVCALLTGLSATAANASTTDGTLTGSASSHLSNGKFAEGNAIWTRSDDHMKTTLHVDTPYLFVRARGTITETIFADIPGLGSFPVWTVSHGLTACAKLDPSCSSSPTQVWDDYPPYWNTQTIETYGSSIQVTVSVN